MRHEANVNAIGNEGETTLHFASLQGHTKIVKILIDAGADVDAIDNCGYIPLYWASHWGCEKIVKILLEDPLCDYTITNKHDITPENMARTRDNQEIVDMLHNVLSVNKKIYNYKKGLQLLAARVANKEGVSEEDYNQLGASFRHCITNIRKDKNKNAVQQQGCCSIQ